MGRTRGIPQYCLHKASGRAVVRINGRDHYLGPWGTQESKRKYQELIAGYLAEGEAGLIRKDPSLTVVELAAAYLDYYAQIAGGPKQMERVRRCCSLLVEQHGETEARHFGPQALAAVRQQMVDLGWSRGHVNECAGVLKRLFKWAVSRELIGVQIHQALSTLEGLRRGRTTAREPEPVLPAEETAIAAALPFLRRVLKDMVEVHLLTGARPGELCSMRASQVDRSGAVWIYTPASHKMAHAGRSRVIYLGPRAQALLEPHWPLRCGSCGLEDRRRRLAWREGLCGPCADLLEEGGAAAASADPNTAQPLPPADGYLFSPQEAVRDWREEQRAARRSKVQPSQASRAKRSPARPPGEHYTSGSYNYAIRRACLSAGVAPWHAHQLRHNAATRLKEEFGWDVARIILGHSNVSTTAIYAEDERRKAIEAMLASG